MRRVKTAILMLLFLSLIAGNKSYSQRGHWGVPAPKTSKLHSNVEALLGGAHVYVFEAGTHGPNTTAFSLIDCSMPGVAGPDPYGNCYVVTDSDGSFNLSGLYYNQCDEDTSLVYLQSTQGSSGAGNNTQISFLSPMPVDCLELTTAPSVYINELTTAAAAFSLQPFANLTALPVDGIATKNASMAALATGFQASNALYSGIYGTFWTAEADTQAQINALANIIDTCVSSTGAIGSGTPCGNLYADTSVAGFTPADTWQSVLSIAENPSYNASALFNLISSTPAWTPTPSSAPSNWNIPINNGPQITSLSVSSGAANSLLTISGTNLTNGSTTPTVVVGGLNAAISGSYSSTSITVVVPTGAINGFVGVYPGNYASNVLPFAITH